MLAKYLIAGGILAANPNQVVATEEVSSPDTSLAVAPERRSRGYLRSIAFSSDGSQRIVGSDAATGDEGVSWNAGGPIASLAYDPEAPRLLVGRADSGTVETYELAGLMASPDGRAPPIPSTDRTPYGTTKPSWSGTEALPRASGTKNTS